MRGKGSSPINILRALAKRLEPNEENNGASRIPYNSLSALSTVSGKKIDQTPKKFSQKKLEKDFKSNQVPGLETLIPNEKLAFIKKAGNSLNLIPILENQNLGPVFNKVDSNIILHWLCTFMAYAKSYVMPEWSERWNDVEEFHRPLRSNLVLKNPDIFPCYSEAGKLSLYGISHHHLNFKIHIIKNVFRHQPYSKNYKKNGPKKSTTMVLFEFYPQSSLEIGNNSNKKEINRKRTNQSGAGPYKLFQLLAAARSDWRVGSLVETTHQSVYQQLVVGTGGMRPLQALTTENENRFPYTNLTRRPTEWSGRPNAMIGSITKLGTLVAVYSSRLKLPEFLVRSGAKCQSCSVPQTLFLGNYDERKRQETKSTIFSPIHAELKSYLATGLGCYEGSLASFFDIPAMAPIFTSDRSRIQKQMNQNMANLLNKGYSNLEREDVPRKPDPLEKNCRATLNSIKNQTHGRKCNELHNPAANIHPSVTDTNDVWELRRNDIKRMKKVYAKGTMMPEPIVEFRLGTSSHNECIKVLLDTGARVGENTKHTLMSQRTFDLLNHRFPTSFARASTTDDDLIQANYANGSADQATKTKAYWVKLMAIDSFTEELRGITIKVLVANKIIDDYELVMGFEYYIEHLDPDFVNHGRKNWHVSYRKGPLKGMNVKAYYFNECRKLLAIEPVPVKREIVLQAQTITPVSIDLELLESISDFKEGKVYIAKLGNGPILQNLTAQELIFNRKTIEALQKGTINNLMIRIINENKNSRKLNLFDFLRIEEIGSNELIIPLSGHVVPDPKDPKLQPMQIYGEDEEGTVGEDVSSDQISKALDEVEHDLTKKVEEIWKKESIEGYSNERLQPRDLTERFASLRKSAKQREKRETRKTVDDTSWIQGPKTYDAYGNREDKLMDLLSHCFDLLDGNKEDMFQKPNTTMSFKETLTGSMSGFDRQKTRNLLGGMSKNSYKKEEKKKEGKTEEEELLKEIEEKQKKVFAEKPVDVHSQEWKDKVWNTLYDRMADGLKTELKANDEYLQRMKKTFQDFAFCYHEEGCPTPTYKNEEADVEKKNNPEWKIVPNFRLSPLDKIRLKWIVSEELRKGNLVKWVPGMRMPLHASPAFIAARKGHLTGRMVVDFRHYNKQVKMPVYSMPLQEDILADLSMGDAKWFGGSDLATGYFHATLSEEEKQYLAITTEDGVYISQKLQLGPSWAPTWFQSRSRSAFPKPFHVYIDDILFKAKTTLELIELIELMHQRSEKTGFVLSLKKTYIGTEQIDCLGHVITVKGRCASPSKIQLIREWPLPANAKNLTSFICVCVYLREYIYRFPDKVYAFKKYLRKKEPIEFAKFKNDQIALRSFEILKKSLESGATIRFLDRHAAINWETTGRQVMVYVDASLFGVSFVITQAPGFNQAPKIAVYKARSFTAAERRWSTFERELYSILYFCQKGADYIQGLPVILCTDHKNCGETELMTVWSNNRSTASKISRWCERIMNTLVRLNIKRHYIPGPTNILADAGSRITETGKPDTQYDAEIPEYVINLVRGLFGDKQSDLKEILQLATDEFQAERQQDEESQLEKEKENMNRNITKNISSFYQKVKTNAIGAISQDGSNKEEFPYEETAEVFEDERGNGATFQASHQVFFDLDTTTNTDDIVEDIHEHSLDIIGKLSATSTFPKAFALSMKFWHTSTNKGPSFKSDIKCPIMKNRWPHEGVDTSYSPWWSYEQCSNEEAKKPATTRQWMMRWWTNGKRTPKGTPRFNLTEPKADCTQQQIDDAQQQAKKQAYQDFYEMINLHISKEPTKGEWYIMNAKFEDFKEAISFKHWQRNYAIGPLNYLQGNQSAQSLTPKGNWIFVTNKIIENQQFSVFRLSSLGDNTLGGELGNDQSEDIHENVQSEDIHNANEFENPINPDFEFENWESDEKIKSIPTDDSPLEMDYQMENPEGILEEPVLEEVLPVENLEHKGFPEDLINEDDGKEMKNAEELIQELFDQDPMKEKKEVNLTELMESLHDLTNIKSHGEDWSDRQIEFTKKDLDKMNEGSKSKLQILFDLISFRQDAEECDKLSFIKKPPVFLEINSKEIWKMTIILKHSKKGRKMLRAQEPSKLLAIGDKLRMKTFIKKYNEMFNENQEEQFELECLIIHKKPKVFLEKTRRGFWELKCFRQLMKKAQKESNYCKTKIWFIEGKKTFEELQKHMKNVALKIYKRERSQLESHNYQISEGILHEDGKIVIPKVKTENLFDEAIECQTPEGKILWKKHEKDINESCKFNWFRTYVIHQAHHQSHDFQLTLHTILDVWNYVWMDLELQIKRYQDHCLACRIDKPLQQIAESHSEIYKRKCETWFMDHQGPFFEKDIDSKESMGGPGNAKKGKIGSYLLTIIDDATGFGWITKCLTKDAVTTIQVLKQILLMIGPNHLPRKLRSDNGFGGKIQEFLNEFSNEHGLHNCEHREGSAENPQGQHRIERPHKFFRKFLLTKSKETTQTNWFLDEELILQLQNEWRNKPIYGKYRPADLWFGLRPQYVASSIEEGDHQTRTSRQLIQEFSALRKAHSEKRERERLGTWGLKFTNYRVGDLVLVAHARAHRRSKALCTGNFRFQIFRIIGADGGFGNGQSRFFLQHANGDPKRRFKQPVNGRKLDVLPQEYHKYLTFRAPHEETDYAIWLENDMHLSLNDKARLEELKQNFNK